jgi:uncharacterized protein YbjT (DUF2867 family)
MAKPILITGAAGKTGRALIHALKLRQPDAVIRGFVYREAHRSTLASEGIDDVVIGDIADLTAYRLAARGVGAIYHICPNLHPEEAAIGAVAIRAAQEEGAARLVVHSVLHPQTEQMPHHWQKLRVEEQLVQSGLHYTILQPAAYMQNILAGRGAILNEGVYRIPYAASTRLGMVDLLDVAEAAARVLIEETHAGAIYELASGEVLTQQWVAEILSEVIGRSVRVEQEPLEEWEARVRAAGLGAYQVDTLRRMFGYYESFGFWGNANTLTWIVGRSPTSFGDFLWRELRARSDHT